MSGSTTGTPVSTYANTDYLIIDLRLHLGDIDSSAYRYTDSWLSTSLTMAIKALGRWWRFKYLLDDSNNVYRNTYFPFALSEPPIIEIYDERIIILMAAVIIKNGNLEANAWNLGSWRDAEIYYSNVEAGRGKEASIQRDLDEMKSLLLPPTKRLARTTKSSLPGYLNNDYEIGNIK